MSSLRLQICYSYSPQALKSSIRHSTSIREIGKNVEYAFDYLDAPIKRVAGADVPIPCSPILEKAALPDENNIIAAVKEVCS